MDEKKYNELIWTLTKSISVIISIAVLGYKICSVDTAIVLDFPTLLSLLLALFSVGLSVLFYLKATQTSNNFYENSYKFTKEIAQILVKMESGFGERLKNLDEGYSSVRTFIQGGSRSQSSEVESVKKEIEIGQGELEKVIEERDRIFNEFVENSRLQQDEKDDAVRRLDEKQKELDEIKSSFDKLTARLKITEELERTSVEEGSRNLDNYTRRRVVRPIGVEKIIFASDEVISDEFNSLVETLSGAYVADIERADYFNFKNGLTGKGVSYLRRLAMDEANRASGYKTAA